MKNLKRCSFYFTTSFIVRKYFLFVVVAVTFIVNGFFISNVYALSENITQINFTSISQSIDPDNLSSVISVQTRNVDGVLEKVSETTHIILSSSSPSGQFYNANASSCTTIIESPFMLTMSNNTANKNFCYKDSTPGTHTLEVEAEGKTWTSAIQEIVINGEVPPVVEFTEITQDINTDTTLVKENNPYVIKSIIHVLEGATLNIEAGVIVKFDVGGELIIDGKLNAEGSELDPINFTSFLDDTIGGDTNGDGDATIASIDNWSGIWEGLTFKNITMDSILNNIVLNYGHYGIIVNDTPISSNNLTLNQSITLNHSNSNFEKLSVFGISVVEGSSATINNSVIRAPGFQTIIVDNGSNLNISNSTIYGGGRALDIYGDSTSLLDNVVIDSTESEGDGIIISGENSNLIMKNSTLLNVFSGVYLNLGSSVNIENSFISCSGSCVSGNSADLLMTGSKIFGNESIPEEGYKKYGVSFYKSNGESGGDGGGDLELPPEGLGTEYIFEINNNEIYNLDFGVNGEGGNIKGINNNIYNNVIGASNLSIEDGGGVVDLRNNYWGDKTGPQNEISNPTGLGNAVSNNVLFMPFLLDDPFVIKKKDPVILIPGITGTYLYKNYDDEKEIWPNIDQLVLSLTDSFLYDLSLNIDGSENLEKSLIPKDIIRGVDLAGVHVFDKLIEELEDNGGYIEGTDLFVFPYDWRRSTDFNASFLKEKIDKIILETGASKVDIIAHSMGGLIAKNYIFYNGKEEIDQLVFLGTPQLGAPKAFKALMYGDDMGYGLKFLKDMKIGLLNSKTVKYISQNMPSVYELLPSKKYIEDNGSYIVNNLVDLDYDETNGLMIEKGRNLSMFYFAKDLHDNVDDLDLSGVETHNFVGCGTKTIGGFTIKQKRLWKSSFFDLFDDVSIKYVNGDETVPLVSASHLIGVNIYFAKENTHGSLPSAEGVRQNILSILKRETLQDFSNILSDASNCNISGKVVSTHSPVELHIYDEEGNHTGINSDGDIEYGIDGVNFDILEEENYAFLPDGNNYRIITRATDTGGYDLIIEDQNNNDEITASYNWDLIPLRTTDSSGEIWVGPTYSPLEYSVQMDDNGDGIFDQNYGVGYSGVNESIEAYNPTRLDTS